MKKTARLFTLVIMLAVCLCSCNEKGQALSYVNYEYFGSALTCVVYTDESAYDEFTKRAGAILREIDKAVNYGSNSDIAVFNDDDAYLPIEIGKCAYEIVTAAKTIYELTDGAYNPCLYYLVDLWGFTGRFDDYQGKTEVYDREKNDGKYPLPESKYVEAFRSIADFDKVRVYEDGGKYYLQRTAGDSVMVDGVTYRLKMDFGGAVKGYAVDRIAAAAKDAGIERGYFSYGTSSLALFKNKDGGDWDLTLTNPRRDLSDVFSKPVYLYDGKSDVNVSSSGDYEKYYEINGRRYSHIIDASTGEPINNGITAATVIGGSALYGDMLSTALCVMGKEKALNLLKSAFFTDRNTSGCIAVTENGVKTVYCTDKDLTVCDYSYEVRYV